MDSEELKLIADEISKNLINKNFNPSDRIQNPEEFTNKDFVSFSFVSSKFYHLTIPTAQTTQ